MELINLEITLFEHCINDQRNSIVGTLKYHFHGGLTSRMYPPALVFLILLITCELVRASQIIKPIELAGWYETPSWKGTAAGEPTSTSVRRLTIFNEELLHWCSDCQGPRANERNGSLSGSAVMLQMAMETCAQSCGTEQIVHWADKCGAIVFIIVSEASPMPGAEIYYIYDAEKRGTMPIYVVEGDRETSVALWSYKIDHNIQSNDTTWFEIVLTADANRWEDFFDGAAWILYQVLIASMNLWLGLVCFVKGCQSLVQC